MHLCMSGNSDTQCLKIIKKSLVKTFKQAFFDFGAKIQMRHLGDFQTSVQCETFFKYIQTLYFSKRGGAGKNMTSVLFKNTRILPRNPN